MALLLILADVIYPLLGFTLSTQVAMCRCAWLTV